MRQQKKSNLIYYILGLVIIGAIVFVVMHEVPMQVEHVEENIPVAL